MAEGYDCWVSSAQADRAAIADAYADGVADAVGEAVGEADEPDESAYDSSEDEPRKCPTLPEIEAVRTARRLAPEGTVIELVRREYTLDDDDDGDDDVSETVYRTVIVLTIPHEFGARDREWVIRS